MSRDAPPLDGLDLNLLVSLRALLLEASVTRAALRLGQSQPAMSRSLQTLREAFEDELLVRSGRNMVLTPMAKALKPPLEHLLLAADRLRTVGTFDPQQAQRRFTLRASDLLCVQLIPALAQRLSQNAPNITIVVSGSERDQLGALLSGEIDVVVGLRLDHAEVYQRAFPGPGSDWSVVLGPLHPAYHDSLDFETWLASTHLQLIPEGRPEVSSALDLLLESKGRTREVNFQIGHVAAISATLQKTAMLTTLPTPIAEQLVKGYELKVVKHPLNSELPPLRIFLNWHSRMQNDQGHAWLREQVLASSAVSP